jgi:predicted DNA-binding transcriptional regulator YafY
MSEGRYTIDELAAETGVSARMIRDLVNDRVLPPALGRGGGWYGKGTRRHYNDEHLDGLRKIVAANAKNKTSRDLALEHHALFPHAFPHRQTDETTLGRAA